jgi:murein DD-endopeptidase MepM/ murein hydrolase activator NlpD
LVNCRNSFKPAAWGLIVSLSAILPAEGAWAQIEGRVVDLFGKPVPAATVSIQGLRLRTQTNDNGEFRLEYVPGSMVVLATKDGYLPVAGRGSLSLNLSTVSRVPIADLLLVLVPPANGLFLVGKTGYVQVAGFETLRKQSGTSAFDQRVVWSLRGPYVRLPNDPGHFFVLRGLELSAPGAYNEVQLKAVRVQARGVVAEGILAPFGRVASVRADVVQDIPLSEVADGLVGGGVVLPSDGLYAICEWRQSGMLDPDRVPKICYPIAQGDVPANAAGTQPDAPNPPSRDTSALPPSTAGATAPVPPKVSAALVAPADPRLFYLPTKARATALEDFGDKALSNERSSPELSGYATGINLAGPGDAVAAAHGRVVRIVDVGREDKDFGLGNTVILEHVLESGDTLYSLYAHLAGFSSEIRMGQVLRRGTVIGPIGSSGYGREKYWLSTRASPRCVRPTLNINPTFCVRLHFELKTKPVLENPSGEKVCLAPTLLGSKSSLCYGYAPQDPTELGYVDPNTVFGRVRVKADSSPPAAGPDASFQGVAPPSLGQSVGLVFTDRNGQICIVIANASLATGRQLALAWTSANLHVSSARISRPRQLTCEHGVDWIPLSPKPGEYLYDVATERPGSGMGFAVLVDPQVLRTRNSGFEGDIDGDGTVELLRTCYGGEGQNFRVWTGEPPSGRLKWERYHYFGYDTPADCPAQEPRPPVQSDPALYRKCEAYIAQSIAQIQLPPPSTGWREIMAMTFGGTYDEYQQLYVRAVNRRSLSVDALASASEFLKNSDLTNVERFAAVFARHFQESNDLLRDANRVVTGGVRNTADALNAMYRASSEASRYGWTLLCGPKCYEVADYSFLMLDFAVDNALVGADEATKKLVTKAVIGVLLESGLANWTTQRTTQAIGQSGLYRLLEEQLRSPQIGQEIMKFVGTSGGYAVQRITEEGVQQVLRSAAQFIRRSSQQGLPR